MKPTHVTLLAIPGIGHLTPILELAKHIVAFGSIDVSLLVLNTDASPAQSQLLTSTILPKGLEIVDIPSVDIACFVDEQTDVVTRISVIVRESLPHIESSIIKTARPTILVLDFFGTAALDIMVDNLCIQKYIFFPSTAACLAFVMYLPTLDQQVDGEFIHLSEPIQVPGCTPIHIDDLVNPVQARYVDEYKWFLYHASRFPMAHGILINTCQDLEPISLSALTENPILQQIPMPPVYPVGPLIHMDKPMVQSKNECMTWLDNQPNDSVLFVSFGSSGTLSAEQVTELAWGLELSQQRFIWVVRKPSSTETTSGTFFTVGGGEQSNPCDYLPDGFMSRTKDVGFVVPSWAPQVDILAHKSTGGFLSHCGWNSTLESVLYGVPIIAWPLYAEQKMNATLLVEELGVAVKPKVEKGEKVVRREEIARAVRLVMKGKEVQNAMRERVEEMKRSCLIALDEGGSSYNSLSQVIEKWKTSCIGLENVNDDEERDV
ncbi:Udp-glycosyltransferase 72b1 [Thalictrum thalictroides]|uniref:Glycosyltransferase n=1 Tax=Thalictrum thalictroides TaxID=46969 RepID=A0A7J6VE26_THATH|nr:Udp-glycosyltransferase 72b1 [Thalictrum thalictroides]